MSAGTITVTNDSDVIQGDGTAFDKDLVANDMVVCVIGGVTYTLVVKTVDSATQVTLLKKYDGPTQAGAAWYAVPRKAMNLITAQLSAETSKAMRGMNYDKQNWQQVFSGTGDITVILPDGSTYTGPAWNSFTSSLDNKLDKTIDTSQEIKGPLTLQSSLTAGPDSNLDVSGFARFRKSSTFDETIWAPKGITVVGALGDATPAVSTECVYQGDKGTWSGAAIFAKLTVQGSTKSMMVSCRQEIGTMDYGLLSYHDWMGNWHEVRLENTGNMNNLSGGWTTGSDQRIKTDIKEVEDPIALIRSLKLYSFKKNGREGLGGIAQEIEQSVPIAVTEGGSWKLPSGEEIKKVKSVDYTVLGYVALAALNKALDRIETLEEEMTKLKNTISK
ncbi:hypothetical protein SME38J_05150 [Serratia marcescens]|nr:hypothetical protein SME38J_05150 [Serratia marcescens]